MRHLRWLAPTTTQEWGLCTSFPSFHTGTWTSGALATALATGTSRCVLADSRAGRKAGGLWGATQRSASLIAALRLCALAQRLQYVCLKDLVWLSNGLSLFLPVSVSRFFSRFSFEGVAPKRAHALARLDLGVHRTPQRAQLLPNDTVTTPSSSPLSCSRAG